MKLSWRDCLKIGVSIFGLYLAIHYWPSVMNLGKLIIGAALPLLIGCAVAYVVNILMTFYEDHFFRKSRSPVAAKLCRPVCLAGAFISLIAVVVMIVWLILPQLSSCVQIILSELPDAINELLAFVETLGIVPEDILASLENVDWQNVLRQVLQVVTSGIGSVMDVLIATVSSVFSGVVTALLSVIFAIYLLLGKETLGRQLARTARHYLKSRICDKLGYLLMVVDDCFHRYIVGQCIEAVIIGVLCAVGMAALRLPYATMIGALVGFTALIPVAGAYIGAVVGAFMILTVNPLQAIIFLVFLVVLQQIEGNLIYPKVVGSSLGLPGIWVLSAVTVGGGILGVAGMLLGVPLAAAAYRIVRDDVNRDRIAEPAEEPGE